MNLNDEEPNYFLQKKKNLAFVTACAKGTAHVKMEWKQKILEETKFKIFVSDKYLTRNVKNFCGPHI